MSVREAESKLLARFNSGPQHIVDSIMLRSNSPEIVNLRAALAADAERVSVPRELHYELDGVIADVEHGNGFDAVCLSTIKRVRDALAGAEKEPRK
jgi:hypothetical protein